MSTKLLCPHCNSDMHQDCVWKERVATVKKLERWIVRNYDKYPNGTKVFDEVLSELGKLLK